jgi:glycosyltransferase involved in cell wall biosynthesis
MRVCVHTVGDGGVAFYRTKQPYLWVGNNSDIDVFIYDPKAHSPQRLKDEIEAADVLVYQMCFGEFIKNIILDNKKRIKPKKIVLEYDDFIFGVHPMNPAYKTFGTEEIFITYKDKFSAQNAKNVLRAKGDTREIVDNPDGSSTFEMWKDGKDGFHLKENRLRALGAQYAIAHCDLVTVTNNYLGKQYRKYRPTGPIAVVPNVVDFKRWLPMKKNESKEIRLGWQGGSAHYQDLHLVRKPLWKLLDKHPNLKIVLQGVGFDALFKPNPDNGMKDYSDRIEWRAWHSDNLTYPVDLREMKADIAMCPVIDDPFNRGKSELKWVEFGAMKVPCVVSPVCYTSVKHGKTGFVANNENEWFEYLDKLISDEAFRLEMGERVYERIKNHHSVEEYRGLENILRDLMANNVKKFVTAHISKEKVLA